MHFLKKQLFRSHVYLDHVRSYRCTNHDFCGALGPSDPDHVGKRGVGQKSSDLETIPLCRNCHRARTDTNKLPGRTLDETRALVVHAMCRCLIDYIEKTQAHDAA